MQSIISSLIGTSSPAKFLSVLLLLGILQTFTIKTTTTMAASSKISSALLSRLQNSQTATAVVLMNPETQTVLDRVGAQQFANRGEKATAVTKALQANADEAQRPVKELLDSLNPPLTYKSMWINNSIFVYGANLEIVERIAQIPGVRDIREEQTAHIMS